MGSHAPAQQFGVLVGVSEPSNQVLYCGLLGADAPDAKRCAQKRHRVGFAEMHKLTYRD